jgi:hypothetical protein
MRREACSAEQWAMQAKCELKGVMGRREEF